MPDPLETGLWTAVLVLAVAGTVNALRVHSAAREPVAAVVPEDAACTLEDPAACKPVFHTPHAALFAGIPNYAFGIVYYALVIAAALQALLSRLDPLLRLAVNAGTLAAVVVSLYLFFHLVFVRRVTCTLCFIGHGINVALAILVIWLMKIEMARPQGGLPF